MKSTALCWIFTMILRPAMISSTLVDGFAELSDEKLALGTPANFQSWRDMLSRYSPVGFNLVDDTSGLVADRYYGLVFTRSLLTSGRGMYGSTAEFPQNPIDLLANRGFLRIPYQRIPRIWVSTRDELSSVLEKVRGAFPKGKLLLRGQVREHLLNRSPESNAQLYDDPQAAEPALLPSSQRAEIDFDALLPEWQWILSAACDAWADALHPEGMHVSSWFNTGFSFQRFAIALAQHYGLPSMGLDVTDDLEVALYFATTQITLLGEKTRKATAVHIESNSNFGPVLYLFNIQGERHYISYQSHAIHPLFALRPTRQQAFFLHRGWGWATNIAAVHIIAAIYFENPSAFYSSKATSNLFPTESEDRTPVTIMEIAKGSSPEMQAFLSRLYFVDGP